MSKKAVKVRKSYVKQWFAVITGSLFASSIHAAHAAPDTDRPTFREFRDQNAGIDRQAARQMYRQEFGIGRGAGIGTPMVPSVTNAGKTNLTVPTLANTPVVPRMDKLSRRLERHGVINQSVQGTQGNLVNIRHGVNLDLSSSIRNITLGKNLFDNGVSSVEIRVGSETKTVQAGSQVSAAEYIAVKQILSGSAQKILIGSVGSATGGEVDLGAITANNDVLRASDLTVPVNVTTYGDFSKRSDFKLLGDLNNAGTIHTYGNGRNGGAIRADDIINQVGAQINADSNLGLFANGNLSNYGSITSKGSVTLSAGNVLTNSGSVSAKNDLNLNAPNVVNSGSIQSIKGDINIDAPSTTELNVDGAGGSFTAARDINVRAADYAGSFNTTVHGGDFFSKQLNLNAGNGVMRVDVQQLTGTVNQTGSEAHLSAATEDLNIGEICLTGDPTYKNSSGNINITGNISVNEKLAIIASGNITSVNNITISTSQVGGGYDIFMAAGAEQTPGGTNTSTVPGAESGTTLTGFASNSGGSIVLGSNVLIDSRGQGTDADGGNVELYAFSGMNFNSGRIDVGNTTILTGGTGTGANGGVTVVAGAVNTTAIRMGTVDTTGGGTSGLVIVNASQPMSSNGSPIIFDADGNITSGNGLVPQASTTNGAVTLAGNISAADGIGVGAGGTISIGAGVVLTNYSTTTAMQISSIAGIVSGGNSSLLVSDQMLLSATSGIVGSISNRVRIDANYLSLLADSVYVSDVDDVTLQAVIVQDTADIQSVGNLTVDQSLSADHVVLRSTGADVTIDFSVEGYQDVRLRAFNSINGSGYIDSPQTYVTSDTGSVVINLHGGNVVVNAASALITSDQDLTFAGGTSVVTGNLSVQAGSENVATTSNISAGSVDIVAQSLDIQSTIIGANYVALESTGIIENADLASSTLITPNLILEANGSVGTVVAPVQVDANSLVVSSATGGVFISDPNNLYVSGSAAGAFNIVAANNLLSSGILGITAPSVELTATNGSLQIASVITALSVNLTSGNSITSSSFGTMESAPGVPVGLLSLTSTNGSIGSSGARVETFATNAAFDAFGSVYVTNTGTGGMVLDLANSSSGGDFSVEAGTLTVNGSFDASRNLDLGSTDGDLVILSSGITADHGAITFRANGNLALPFTVVSASGDINFQSTTGGVSIGSQVTSTAGSINAVSFGTMSLTFADLEAANSITATSVNDMVSVVSTDLTTITGDIHIAGDNIFMSDVAIESGRDFVAEAVDQVSYLSGSITARDVTLRSDDLGIVVFGPITASRRILLDSASSILNTNFAGTATNKLFADQIDLISRFGTIGDLVTPLDIDAVNLTANAPIVNISDPNSINIGGGSSRSTFGSFTIVAVDDITTSGTIGSGSFIDPPIDPTITVTLTAGGNVEIGASIGAGTVNLNAGNNLTSVNGAYTDAINLNLNSTNGDIGVDASERFLSRSLTLTVNSGGDAYVLSAQNPAGVVDIIGNNVISGTFDLLKSSPIPTTENIRVFPGATLTAADVVLSTNYGLLLLNGTVTGTNSVTLTQAATFSNSNLSGLAFTPTLNLVSVFGDVGDDITPFEVNANNFSGNAFGGVYANRTGAALNVVGTNSANGAFRISSTGDLTVLGTIDAPNTSLTSTGGSVAINSAVTTVNLSIFSDGGIFDTDLTGTISTVGLHLETSSGDIDVTSVDAANLSFDSAGSMRYVDANGLNVQGPSSANGNISIEATGNLTSDGMIVSATGDITLVASSGSLDLGGIVRAPGTISLTSSGSITNSSIAGLDGGAGLPVQNLILVSTSGDIGTSGGQANALAFNAITVSANAAAGSVYLNDTGNDIALDSSSALGEFQLWAAGDVHLNAGETLSADSLYINSSGGGITFAGDATIASRIELISLDDIVTANFASPLSAPTIVLNATGAGAEINITTDFENVSASADTVVLTDTNGSMNIGPGSSAAGSFVASAPQNITNDGAITAAIVDLTATGGGFTFNNAITGTTSISLTSFDDILNGTIAGQLITPALIATSTNGDIGAALDPLTLNVDTITLNAALGNVWVDNAGTMDVNGASSAQGIFSLLANGQITVLAPVSAADVELRTSVDSDAFILISSPVTATTSVTISSDDGIYNADGMGNIVSPAINLIATGGDIGQDGNLVQLNTDVLSIQSTGDAFVSNSTALEVTSVSAAGNVGIEAAGSLTTTGIVSGVDVSLTTLGSLQLNALVRGTNSISLTSAGSILNSNIVGGLDSGAGLPVNQLNLTSTGGSIGTFIDPLEIEATSASFNAPTGSIFVYDPTDLNLGGGSSSSSAAPTQAFYVYVDGSLTSTSSIFGHFVYLSTGQSFDLDGSVTGAGSLALESVGGIQNSNISGGLTTPELYLTSGGNIGAIGDRLLVDTNTLFAETNNGSVFITDPNAVSLLSSSSAANVLSLTTGTTLTVSNDGSALTAANVILFAGTAITLDFGINGSSSVELLSLGTITQNFGTIVGGDLTVEFVTGPVTLSTNVATLTSGGTGQTLTINEANGIQLLEQEVGTLFVSASQNSNGDVTTGADFAVNTLQITNAGGSIIIDNNVTATTQMSLNTSGGSGSIQQTDGVLTTPVLQLSAGAGGIGTAGNDVIFTNGANDVSLIAGATGGDVSLVYSGTGTVDVQGGVSNGSYTLETTNGGSVVLAGAISGSGALTLLTDDLTNNTIANFDQIHISNTNPSALSITGGTFTTANGFTVLSARGISLSGNILLNGTGDATFTVGDEPDEFIVNTGATVTGVNTVTINACDLVFNGVITGDPLVIVCANNGTIANSLGDVLLPSDLVFMGQNLAILAAGNITTTGSTLIDLSGATGSGSLTLMAGYDFTPATPGQVQGPAAYTITGVSADGGSINLTGVSIVLNGGSGNGGNLTAVSNVGGVNDGSIILGNIETSGAINGGNLNIIGPGGIAVGDITTVSGVTSGNVSMAVAEPAIVGGPITVQNGVLISGSFGVGSQTAGNLIINDIDAGAANVTLTGALGSGTDAILQSTGNLVAGTLSINVGSGIASFFQTAVGVLNASSSGAGQVNLFNEVDAITLNSISGTGLELFVIAGGNLTANSAFAIDVVELISSNDIVLNASVGGASNVVLDASGTITQNAGTVNGGDLFVDFGTGPVTLNTNVATLTTGNDATSLTVNEANDLQLGSQFAESLTVNVADGALTTVSDFTVDDLTINVANGTVEISNSIGATNTASVFADDGITSTGPGVLNGATVILDSNANIGVDSANKLQINATTFQVEAANAFVNNTNVAASTMNASTATGILDVSTVGDLISGGNYNAQIVALATGGAFDVTNTITGTTSISLTTDGDLTNIVGTLTTPTLLLNSVNGKVGTDANNPFLVAANVASIGGSAGDGFFVTSAATGGVNFVGITAGEDISLKANGGLSLTQNITSTNGAFSVEATRDTLDIADGITILAHDQIDITQLGSTKKRDKIVLGAGSSVITNAKTPGLGNVNIILGAPQSPGRKTPTPKKFVTIVENGGSVLFGGKKAQAAGPGIVFTAQGADVYVSTFNPKSIVFEGNNTITADPPVAAGTPIVIRQFGNNENSKSVSLVSNTVPATTAGSWNFDSMSSAINLQSQSTPSGFTAMDVQSNLQLVSLNNANISAGLIDGGNATSSTINMVGDRLNSIPSTLGLSTASSNDDSVIRTNEPSSFIVDGKLCSDVAMDSDVAVEKLPHSSCVTLSNGRVLFVPTVDTSVVTPNGTVQLKANSVSFVVVDGQQLSVYDINDHQKRSVVIEAGGRSIPLSPGKHAVITHGGVQQFSDINPAEAVMHRSLTSHEIGNGRKVFTSEFSVPSALQAVKPLSALLQSKHNHARKVADRVMKTSAIIMQLSPGAMPFEFHAKPRTLALK